MSKKISISIIIALVLFTTGCFGGNETVTDLSGNPKEQFELNETVVYNDVNYSVHNIEYQIVEDSANMNNVIITVKIENNSDDSIDYNILDWVTIDSSEKMSYSVFSSVDSSTTLGSGNLHPDEYIIGTILFVHDVNETSLKLQYLNNSVMNNDYIFEISLN